MGDEGLQVFLVKTNNTHQLGFFPWAAEDLEASVSELIVKKCRRAPVVVFNDMVEQHYRKETIPKASYFDSVNIMKRRLNVAFPNYKIRAALKLKTVSGGKKDGIPYLFAAIPMSNSFNKVLKAVTISGAPIAGFYLLPVEAAALVKDLTAKLNRNKKHKSTWTIFAGQHHNGGLRQIVTRNGELALTRLSPIVDTDVQPDLWAKEVASELDSTMSYLARFGYKATDGLDVIVIANDSLKDSLQASVEIEGDVSILTSYEAARLINSNVGVQEDYRYADVLHAAYLGKKKILKLPLEATAINEVVQPRRIASYAVMGLALGILGLSYMAFHYWQQIADMKDQLLVSTQKTQAMTQEYNLELEKKKALGFDLKLVNNSIEIYNKAEKDRMEPLSVIKAIDQAIGGETHLDKLSFNIIQAPKKTDDYSYGYSTGEMENQLVAVLSISYPSTDSPDESVRKVNDIVEKLKISLPDAESKVVKQVADLSYTGNVTGESRDASRATVQEDYVAEIEIRRPMK